MRERVRRARPLRDRDILVEIIRRAIARRLVDAGNMSPSGIGITLHHSRAYRPVGEFQTNRPTYGVSTTATTGSLLFLCTALISKIIRAIALNFFSLRLPITSLLLGKSLI